MNAEMTGLTDLLLSKSTLAQQLQSPPRGAADQVASLESPEEPVVAAPRSKSKRGRPSKRDQELWTTSSTETLFTVR
ncbi:hypothetical protein GN244_ATG02127 [Phytophthora infestans]|uniref:Uncharacterized protein n=1 Tax=Phytophthora infestans TaxID=4787 RepID=A0A833TKK1_PHYIN|nr:hypothetical protein GN244_ATG02127 [Phytophthora infestans]